MKTLKTKLILAFLSIMAISVKAQVVFTATALSTNIANGTEAVRVSFLVTTDSLMLPNNLTYEDIAFFQIEKTDGGLSKRLMNTINKTKNSTSFTFTDTEIGGGTQEYQLLAIDNSSNSTNIGSQIVSIQAANPVFNCIKLDKLYRKACHNCYEVGPSFKSALDITQVVEIDIHAHETGSVFGNPDVAATGVWFVRHSNAPFSSENNNNCINQFTGQPNQNFNICLENVQQWHLDPSNKGHDPIIVFIDLKTRGNDGVSGPFWTSENNHNPIDLNNVLRQFAIDIGGVHNLYKPFDLRGGFLGTREAAKNGNWPSLGNLRDKIIFVLTGQNHHLSQYVNDLKQANVEPMAFIAVNPDAFANASNGYIPQFINFIAEQEVVFYNLKNMNNQLSIAKTFTSKNGFISRSWESGNTSASSYGNNIFNEVNNIAILNITDNFPSNIILNDKLLSVNVTNVNIGIPSPIIISSKYNHITQHASQTVTTQNLTVLSGTHYNIVAGQEVDLLPGTDIQAGANTDIFISNCEDYIDNMRVNPFANQEQGRVLTQQEIDWILKINIANTEQTIIKQPLLQPAIFPSPTNGLINIELNSNKPYFEIEVFSLLGELVYVNKVNGSKLSFDLSPYPKGMYLVKIKQDNHYYHKKISYY